MVVDVVAVPLLELQQYYLGGWIQYAVKVFLMSLHSGSGASNEFQAVILEAVTMLICFNSLMVAKEMIQHRPYTQKVDVYSFGIVLWELITGMLPFQNMTAVQAAFAVVNKGVRPNIPNDCLPVLSEIMTRCWDANPDVRPPFPQVVMMLENAEMEIITTVRKARFRCCMTQPMTMD
ncbi:unnamed protein product [Camellia sinensis]